jgi:hypothetical protein
MPISIYMSPKAARTLTLVLALALAVVATESASARTKKRVQHPVPPSLMLDSGERQSSCRAWSLRNGLFGRRRTRQGMWNVRA